MNNTATLASVMVELKSKGSENTRQIYARHGLPLERTFGVSNANLKVMAKALRGQQALACELYQTGNVDAMYLAGLVADGSKMSEDQLQAWARSAVGLPMIAEHTVPWVTVESTCAWELAACWTEDCREPIAVCGWSTYSGLAATTPDSALDIPLIVRLLSTVVHDIHSAENRVRYTMNGFVIAVGCYVTSLLPRAREAAIHIGEVSVEMGDTACKVPLATAYIEKVVAAGRAGKKRKTIRC